MLPFELVATATDSPRYSPAGSFRKFGTDEKGISGTPVIVAFCWADAETARSTTAAQVERRCRVMDGSLYQGSGPFNHDPWKRRDPMARCGHGQPRYNLPRSQPWTCSPAHDWARTRSSRRWALAEWARFIARATPSSAATWR